MNPAALLEDVAGAILDGTPVDWNSLESRADQIDQTLVEQLKMLATLRLVARRTSSRRVGNTLIAALLFKGKASPRGTPWTLRKARESLTAEGAEDAK